MTEKTINRRQQALIDLLSQSAMTIAQAAGQLSIPYGTARNWQIQPHFREALERARAVYRQRVTEELEARIAGLGHDAIETKIANLAASSEHVRHLESSYLLDRILGKPKERKELTGAEAGPVEVTHTHEHTFDYAAFRRLIVEGDARGAAAPRDGSGESVDSP